MGVSRQSLRRLGVAAGIVVGVGVVGAFAVRGYMIWDRTRDVLPTFVDVPAGPRAPATTYAGFALGRTSLGDVQAWTQQHQMQCRDASIRGLLQAGREEARQRIAEAKARGEDEDAVSGASRAWYYSKKEQNPQVIWSCENVDLQVLGDLPRGLARGSLSFVFDSATHGLRSLTIERKTKSQSEALAQWELASQALTALLGAPKTTPAKPPAEDGDPQTLVFERLRPVMVGWEFSNVRASLTAMNFGAAKGVSLRELFEVPWPFRVDQAAAEPTATTATAP
jgi:hypothetical protein